MLLRVNVANAVLFTMQTYAHVLAPVRKELAAKMDEILNRTQPLTTVLPNWLASIQTEL